MTTREALAFNLADAVTHRALGIREIRNDPKGRYVAAAAVHSGATLIVTVAGNVSGFRELPAGLAAETPEAFLCGLFGSAPEVLVQVVRAQAAALRQPSRTVHDIVHGFGTAVPRFAALMGSTISGGGA